MEGAVGREKVVDGRKTFWGSVLREAGRVREWRLERA